MKEILIKFKRWITHYYQNNNDDNDNDDDVDKYIVINLQLFWK